MELVKCNNLCKEFDNKKILKDVNLTISKGKIIGLLGKNGMGKTTFLKLINDLLTPTSGEVLINGEKPNINSKEIKCIYNTPIYNIKKIRKIIKDLYPNSQAELDVLKKSICALQEEINKLKKNS